MLICVKWLVVKNKFSGWTYTSSPSPGDIATWAAWKGIAREWGHVALVESVGTVTSDASPGCYTVAATPEDPGSGYNPVCCELIVK